MKKWWIILLSVVVVFFLFFVRLVLPSQIDDVSPGIDCEDYLLDWADVYYVIPKFENVSVDEVWCNWILERDKELSMHGVYHFYEEFGVERDVDYLNKGIKIFEDCFGFEPERFKPPQLEFAESNDWMRERMEIDLIWNQIFHKVYHCGDTGVFPNWFIRIF